MFRDLLERVKKKLLQRYRVELIDDETMYQSRQYRVRPLTVVLIMVASFVLVVGCTMAMVIFVPTFHRLIPGYIDPEAYRQERARTAEQVARIEEEMDRLIAYNQNFQRLAGGGSPDSLPQFSQDRLEAARSNLPDPTPVVEFEDTDPIEKVDPENNPPPEVASSSVGVRTSVVKTASRSVLDELFLPLSGRMSRAYSEAQKHYGVDIVADEGSLIRSATDGFVQFAEYSEDNGWVISVSSGRDNVVTFYKHNSRLLKEIGSYVRAGEAIAVIGNTGENSTGPHLHFELWQNGKFLNPANFINFQ